MNNVKEKVCEVLRPVLTGGETLVVGFSGGADSVTLLHVLLSLKTDFKIADIIAVHVDHGLRGEESARDRLFAETFCEQFDVPFQLYTYDVAAIAGEKGKGLEETGREVRYDALANAAAAFENAYIVTAHTANDNAETLLLHLCRGCGIKGLKGISVKRDVLLRPMLTCTREEIETYCHENNLEYVIDSTNTDTTYARNRIRHRVLPELEKVNPSIIQSLTRLMTHAQQADAFLEIQTERLFKTIQNEETGKFHRTKLLNQHSFLQLLVLEKCAKLFALSTDDYHLREMQRCLNEGGCISLPANHQFKALGDYFYVLPPEEQTPFPIHLSVGQTVSFFSRRYRLSVISMQEYEQKLNIYKYLFKNACDYDMIKGVLTLRSRFEGDFFRPSGRGCTKTLKKLFNEAAVLPEKRAQIPVLCDQNGIILVSDHGCDERVKITEATQRVMLLEKDKE